MRLQSRSKRYLRSQNHGNYSMTTKGHPRAVLQHWRSPRAVNPVSINSRLCPCRVPGVMKCRRTLARQESCSLEMTACSLIFWGRRAASLCQPLAKGASLGRGSPLSCPSFPRNVDSAWVSDQNTRSASCRRACTAEATTRIRRRHGSGGEANAALWGTCG